MECSKIMLNHTLTKTVKSEWGTVSFLGIFVVVAIDGFKSSALYHKQIYKTCRVIIPRKAL